MTTAYTEERLARITRLIDQYRATKQQQLVERAMKLWRLTDANRRFVALLESPPQQVH